MRSRGSPPRWRKPSLFRAPGAPCRPRARTTRETSTGSRSRRPWSPPRRSARREWHRLDHRVRAHEVDPAGISSGKNSSPMLRKSESLERSCGSPIQMRPCIVLPLVSVRTTSSWRVTSRRARRRGPSASRRRRDAQQVALLEDLDLLGVADLEHDERFGPLRRSSSVCWPPCRGLAGSTNRAAGDGSVHPAQLDLGALLRNAEHGTLRSQANSRRTGSTRDPRVKGGQSGNADRVPAETCAWAWVCGHTPCVAPCALHGRACRPQGQIAARGACDRRAFAKASLHGVLSAQFASRAWHLSCKCRGGHPVSIPERSRAAHRLDPSAGAGAGRLGPSFGVRVFSHAAFARELSPIEYAPLTSEVIVGLLAES
jgi:hypothetical protein